MKTKWTIEVEQLLSSGNYVFTDDIIGWVEYSQQLQSRYGVHICIVIWQQTSEPDDLKNTTSTNSRQLIEIFIYI